MTCQFTEIFYGPEEAPEAKELVEKSPESSMRVEGAPYPPGRAPLSRGPLEHLPTDFFRLYILSYPKNIEYQDRLGVPPPQASVATKN